MAKEKTEAVVTTAVEKIKNKINPVIDIGTLVAEARKAYDKKEGGLAKQISTGTSISRPKDDADFIIWTGGSHWEKLTLMKGIPFGRIVQISGKPDSGKTTHVMGFMKNAQEQGVLVILFDTERKFNAARYDAHIGGDSSSIIVVDTNMIIDGARAIAEIVNAAKEKNPDLKILIAWDSIGASLNRTEDNDETEDMSKQPGVTAKEINFAIHKFNKLIAKYRSREHGKDSIAVLVVNQVYANIGSRGVTDKGGGGLYYASSIILQLSRKNDLVRVRGGDKYKYGITTRAKVKKNHDFSGDECIAELDLVISADGVHLADEVKNFDDIKDWDDEEEDNDD
jgi:RecA/RadA recombinase